MVPLITSHDIEKAYQQAPSSEVTLFCTYTTRQSGFIDILLSRIILSSEEVFLKLGKVETHRGSNMGDSEYGVSRNDSISFSAGFVSYGYSNSRNLSKQEYLGGSGVLIPLSAMLKHHNLHFLNFTASTTVTKNNVVDITNECRCRGALHDYSGLGGFFEILVRGNPQLPRYSPNYFPRIPILADSGSIIACPSSQKQEIVGKVNEHQENYGRLYREIQNKLSRNPSTLPMEIQDREFFHPQQTLNYLETILSNQSPLDYITWYDDQNLDVFCKSVSLHLQKV